MDKKYIIGHLMALVTIIIWGTTFVSTKVLLGTLTPLEIMFYRFIIAYVVLLIIHPKFYKFKNIKEELVIFALGLSGITLYFLAENIALDYTLASNVGLILATIPALTCILARIFIKGERLNRFLIIGSLIAFAGVFLVIFNGNYVLNIKPIGDMLALIAAIMFAIYSTLLNYVKDKYNHIYLTRKIFFYGLITMFPIVIFKGINFDSSLIGDYSIIVNLLFLSVIASSICFIMWNSSVEIIGPVKASSYIYLIPVVTMITSKIILDEKITIFSLCGMFLILSGVYLVENGKNLIGKLSKA